MSISSNFVGISGGLLMSIIAFSIVFIVIAGLILLMYGLKGLAGAIDSSIASRAAPEPAPAPAPVQAAPAVHAASAPAPTQATAMAADDGELLAVITAAIAATCGTAAQVVSFREAPRGSVSSAWRTTGRLQNCEGFID